MTTYRTHYLTLGGARCGNPMRRNWTVDPTGVTCESCKRLMKGDMK
jgi:hypothetical protein